MTAASVDIPKVVEEVVVSKDVETVEVTGDKTNKTTDGDSNVVKEVVVSKVVEVSVPTIQFTKLYMTVNLMRMNDSISYSIY